MSFSGEDFERLRSRVRLKVSYDLGFACPDIEDVVQETMIRYLAAARAGKMNNPESVGAFLNGICRNVILEYRRRSLRDEPITEKTPEPTVRGLSEADLLEMRQAVAHGIEQLSVRDRQLLRMFYLEEKSKEEILKLTGMTDANFRVVLCRAKERFRQIYIEQAKHRSAESH